MEYKVYLFSIHCYIFISTSSYLIFSYLLSSLNYSTLINLFILSYIQSLIQRQYTSLRWFVQLGKLFLCRTTNLFFLSLG